MPAELSGKRYPTQPQPAKPETRVTDEPAFILHGYPYKETSLVVEALTRHHGRVALVARGAKRPRSALRGVLLSFQPLALGWSSGRGKGSELRTLMRAEWVGGLAPLRGAGLLCGFYLNELVIKLLARDDPHEILFDEYIRALAKLAAGEAAAPILRGFEYILLREAGYALRLGHCVDSDAPIRADARYLYIPERGPVLARARSGNQSDSRQDRRAGITLSGAPKPKDQHERAPHGGLLVRGKTLLDIEAGDYADPVTLRQSKLLMRQLLNHHLAGNPLNTRQIMADLHNL